mmetsp:Transcript_30111/g.61421  ORF Transcript_30111/g.61421 Transcript_30111/m.61421 type:complete len:251 (-) Transcript_30111:175-927(-)
MLLHVCTYHAKTNTFNMVLTDLSWSVKMILMTTYVILSAFWDTYNEIQWELSKVIFRSGSRSHMAPKSGINVSCIITRVLPPLRSRHTPMTFIIPFHLCLNCGFLLPKKASIPSFWSSVANREWNNLLSNLRPSLSVISSAAFTASLAIMTATLPLLAMVKPNFVASSTNASDGTTLETNPSLSALSASIVLPLSTISIALLFPTARTSLCVPPAPGITPRLISGCPNFAPSPASTTSHIMANSHPPPSA